MSGARDFLGWTSSRVVEHLVRSNGVRGFLLSTYVKGSSEGRSFPATSLAGLEGLLAAEREMDPRTLVGFSSLVETAEGYRHFPLLDFASRACPNDSLGEGLEGAVACLRRLGQDTGFILDSGRSYHYYGQHPMGLQEWRDFMRAAAGDTAIGPFYPVYQFRRGAATLRLTTDAESGKPQVPVVAAVLGDPGARWLAPVPDPAKHGGGLGAVA